VRELSSLEDRQGCSYFGGTIPIEADECDVPFQRIVRTHIKYLSSSSTANTLVLIGLHELRRDIG
jgi:hypothetical protein